MSTRILILIMLPLILLGCQDEGLNIKIKYDEIHGLEMGGRVIFNENNIGDVKDVFYTQKGYYSADVIIKKDFANAVTEHSKFYIVTDPKDKKSKAIEMILAKKGGMPLKDGAIVQGSTRSSSLSGMGDNEPLENLEELKRQFERLADELKKIPESKEFKELEKEFEDLGEEMKKSGEEAGERIQKRILPRLKREFEKIKKRLRRFIEGEKDQPQEV